MLFKVNEKNSLVAVQSDWVPGELELESYLVEEKDEGHVILSELIFGEKLLLIDNQVRTKHLKRSDILALDSSGNSVIIELKKKKGKLGVETQALQYLADFSSYQGEEFVKRFSLNYKNIEEDILSFLGGDFEIKNLNKSPRVILMAKEFDKTVYSLGEWLSDQGVSFRCISYTPVEMNNEKYLSFSVTFDRSPIAIYSLNFGPVVKKSGIYWHNIARSDQGWWDHLKKVGQIPACFENAPRDQGESVLNKYVDGDIVIAFAKGKGAIGWGKVNLKGGKKYRLIPENDPAVYPTVNCRHRLPVKWQSVVGNLEDAVPVNKIRNDFGIYHPISTSVSIKKESGEKLVQLLTKKFGKAKQNL